MVDPRRRLVLAMPDAPSTRGTTTVQLSEVLAANLRLEASAYNLEAREAIQSMRASGLPLVPLFGDGGLCEEAHNAFRFSRVYVGADRGIPLLSSSDIISMRPETDSYLSRKLTSRLPSLLVKKWDVLISCSGTIGNVGLASEAFAGKALSQHVIRVTAPDVETAGYISAFLRSAYGRPQLRQAGYGSVVVHIEPEHLHQVLIPDLPPIRRVAIGGAIVRAYEARDEANRLLDEVDVLLHQRLGLPPLDKIPSALRLLTSSRVPASRLGGRFEATYHDPTVLAAEDVIRRLPVESMLLGDDRLTSAISSVTKFRERVYVEHGGIPMLSSKQLFQIDPIETKNLAKGAHTKDLPELRLEAGMILVTRSGTVGRVQIVPGYMEGWTASEHAIRVVPHDQFVGGYLYAWLASDYGHKLITRHSYGSIVIQVDREMLSSIPVPLPSREILEEIGGIVVKANRLRDDAWRQERGAITQLEELIAPAGR